MRELWSGRGGPLRSKAAKRHNIRQNTGYGENFAHLVIVKFEKHQPKISSATPFCLEVEACVGRIRSEMD